MWKGVGDGFKYSFNQNVGMFIVSRFFLMADEILFVLTFLVIIRNKHVMCQLKYSCTSSILLSSEKVQEKAEFLPVEENWQFMCR